MYIYWILANLRGSLQMKKSHLSIYVNGRKHKSSLCHCYSQYLCHILQLWKNSFFFAGWSHRNHQYFHVPEESGGEMGNFCQEPGSRQVRTHPGHPHFRPRQHTVSVHRNATWLHFPGIVKKRRPGHHRSSSGVPGKESSARLCHHCHQREGLHLQVSINLWRIWVQSSCDWKVPEF